MFKVKADTRFLAVLIVTLGLASAASAGPFANILTPTPTPTPTLDTLEPVNSPEFSKLSDDVKATAVIKRDGTVSSDKPNIFTEAVSTLKTLGDKIASEHKTLVEKAVEKEKKLMEQVSNFLDQLNISIYPKENVWTHNDVLGVGIGYRWATAPAYIGVPTGAKIGVPTDPITGAPLNTKNAATNAYHSREDSYVFNPQMNPFNFQNWLHSVALIYGNGNLEMDMWQFFDSREEAQKGKHWYKPKNFPLTAERAMNNDLMKAGDMAHLTASVTVELGGQHYWQMANELGCSPEAGYLLNGIFHIFVLKAEDNLFHLRMIAQRQHGVFETAACGVNANFNPLGWMPLTRALIHATNIDQILYGFGFEGDLNVYMADYVLNLNDPNVAKIYDRMLDEVVKFKKNDENKKLIETLFNPLKSNDDVGAELKFDTKDLDQLYFEDMNKPEAQQRVKRYFSGSDFAVDKPNIQIKAGIGGIARDERSLIRRDNSMVNEVMGPDGSDTAELYFFPMITKTDDFHAGLSFFAHKDSRAANMIFKAKEGKDGQFVPTDFESIGFYLDRTDKRYTEGVHGKIVKHFEEILPPDGFDSYTRFLDAIGLQKVDHTLSNIRTSARYFIDSTGFEAALAQYNGLTPDERVQKIREMLIAHLDRVPRTDRNQEFLLWLKRVFVRCGEPYSSDPKINRVCSDVEDIARRLSVVFDTSINSVTGKHVVGAIEREQQMSDLARNRLFFEVGPGFLLAAIPPEMVKPVYGPTETAPAFFEVKDYLPGKKTAIFPYPTQLDENGKPVPFPHRNFYETILDIQNIMNNMTPDMRIPSDTLDDLTHRKTKDGMSSGTINGPEEVAPAN